MPSDHEVVATRTFDRDDGEILLCIYKPLATTDPAFDNISDDPLWKCEYELQFPDGEVRLGSACGCDGVEALLLVMARVQCELHIVMDGSGERRPTPRWLGDENLGLDIIHF